jgi:hypothetical protein
MTMYEFLVFLLDLLIVGILIVSFLTVVSWFRL